MTFQRIKEEPIMLVTVIVIIVKWTLSYGFGLSFSEEGRELLENIVSSIVLLFMGWTERKFVVPTSKAERAIDQTEPSNKYLIKEKLRKGNL